MSGRARAFKSVRRVHGLAGGPWAKTYSPWDQPHGITGCEMWANELGALMRVAGMGGMQQLDEETMLSRDFGEAPYTIWTRHAGAAVDRISEREAFALAANLSRAGIEHRDIRPLNLVRGAPRELPTLIDFEWAIYPGSPIEGFPTPEILCDGWRAHSNLAGLLLCAGQEGAAALGGAVAKLGGRRYAGSTVRPGWSYQPLYVPGGGPYGMPGAEVHKPDTPVEEFDAIARVHRFQPGESVLDIGCNCGYFSLRLATEFGARADGIDMDPANIAVARALYSGGAAHGYGPGGCTFTHGDAMALDWHGDTALMLNVHMWMHRARGGGAVEAFMRRLAGSCRTLYFQTAHAESGGMTRVEELGDLGAVCGYLLACGFRSPELIYTSDHSDSASGRRGDSGLRYMLRAEGLAPRTQ